MKKVKLLKKLCLALVMLILVQVAVISVKALDNQGAEAPQAESWVPAETQAAPLASAITEEPSEEVIVPKVTLVTELVSVEIIPKSTEVEKKEKEKVTIDTVPLYYQTDYPNEIYGNGSVATSGCSITSIAMVATYMTDHVYLPDELADYFGGRAENNIARMEYASDVMQLPYEKGLNFHESIAALKEGKVVIALMESTSIFTESQHFIVLAGYNENGKIIVHDPYEPNYSHWQLKRAFAEGFSEGDVCAGFGGGWAYDKSAMPEEPFIYKEEKVEVECRYPGVELTYEEKILLSKMVWVEAQGEPIEGQQAVAEVVLNRLVAEDFQDSIKGVIYADGQFRSTAFLDDAQPNQTQYEAVERALEGPYVLPIDVVFFATYPVTDSVWGDIGGHTFCYRWEEE